MRLLKGKRERERETPRNCLGSLLGRSQLQGIRTQSQESQANCFCLSNASRISAEMALAYAR
jgi:hypothetical protein